jgi:hypothetical protein
MLKRARSRSESRGGGRKISSSTMTDLNAHSGDRKRTCAFTIEACQILNELRKTNLLCDARISTKKDITEQYIEFPVHRFILAGKYERLSLEYKHFDVLSKPLVHIFAWLLRICNIVKIRFYN